MQKNGLHLRNFKVTKAVRTTTNHLTCTQIKRAHMCPKVSPARAETPGVRPQRWSTLVEVNTTHKRTPTLKNSRRTCFTAPKVVALAMARRRQATTRLQGIVYVRDTDETRAACPWHPTPSPHPRHPGHTLFEIRNVRVPGSSAAISPSSTRGA